MNTRLSRSRRSFRWDLGAARKGGVPAGALGVVAQECGRKEDSTYVPLDVAGVSDTGNYEAQLLASNKLADVYFTVTDVQPDGSQRVVLSRRRAEFTNDLRPRIMVKVPRSATGRGKYRVNLQLYGANNRGDGNVSFAFWHD
jgi:hypothetical protein